MTPNLDDIDATYCTSSIIHDGATWFCGRRRHHDGDHEAIGVQHPKDAENYRMRWSTPIRHTDRVTS